MSEEIEKSSNETMNQTTSRPSLMQKYWWIILIMILVIGGAIVLLQNNNDSSTNNLDSNSAKSGTPDTEQVETSAKAETWTRNSDSIAKDTTSTDTHKISDTLYRQYRNGQGAIYYFESSDGITWGSGKTTGITEDSDKMISNPAAAKLTNGSWIMIYEQAPRRQPGQTGNVPAGPTNQRNLYRATSNDGISWSKQGLAIDSSVNDNYFASVPDLVLLPESKVRMYYVCRGDSVCSQISSDNGTSWTKESGFRLTDTAVDPNVLYENNQWIMYYSILNPSKNGLYKAVSKDGLLWTELEGQIIAKSSARNAIVDPDVYEIANGSYVMNFGESTSNGSTGGEQINLYNATFQGEIFE